MLAKFKIAAAVSISILASPVSAQGVPTFDSQSILKEIAQLDQMLQDFGIQNDQLAELQNQLQVLQDQYDRLQEIQAALQDPTSLMNLVMGDGLDAEGQSGSQDRLVIFECKLTCVNAGYRLHKAQA